jgi:glycosyltransferase involved in cell wall biosynthesis
MSKYLLITGDFVKTGGMDRANVALASYLARRGDEVHLVAFRADAELLAFPNVTFHRIAKPLRSYTLALPLLDRAGRRVAQQISDRGGHVIVNGGSARWGDVNWVHYVHAAHDPQFHSLPRRIVGRYNHRRWLRDERQALGAARTIFANSQRTRRDLVQRLDVPPDRVHVVYYGVDPRRFRPADDDERASLRARLGIPPDRKIVLFIGALSDRRKGFDILFDAWRRLDLRAKLWVIGAGSEIGTWRRRAASIGSIEFLGHRDDVPDLLRAADLLVSPTRYEAYGLAVHEALCCGVPVIVSASAGVAERFPESLRHLLLKEADNVEELAGRLRQWGETLSQELRARVLPLSVELRCWTWDDMAAQMLELIENPGRTPARVETGEAVHT